MIRGVSHVIYCVSHVICCVTRIGGGSWGRGLYSCRHSFFFHLKCGESETLASCNMDKTSLWQPQLDVGLHCLIGGTCEHTFSIGDRIRTNNKLSNLYFVVCINLVYSWNFGGMGRLLVTWCGAGSSVSLGGADRGGAGRSWTLLTHTQIFLREV